LQGTRDSFGSPEEIRAAIGASPGITVVDLPGADHGYRIALNARSRASNPTEIAQASSFTPADLRTTVVSEVSGFICTAAGISTS
jgi:predicted alpha/beta-hydrolase family hydrolase